MKMPKKPLVFTLIAQADWDRLRKILKKKTSMRVVKLLQEKGDSKLNCLAIALSFNAPPDIIQRMIELAPDLISKTDDYGATSLHISCLNGAPAHLLELVIKHKPETVEMVDCDRRAALHHAVEYACQNGTEQNSYLDVIRLLCDASLEMINCRDVTGETPIDLLQFVKSNTDPKSQEHKRLDAIYSYLRNASIQLYKNKKDQWESKAYVTNVSASENKSGSQPSLVSTEGSASASLISLQNPISLFLEADENMSCHFESSSNNIELNLEDKNLGNRILNRR